MQVICQIADSIMDMLNWTSDCMSLNLTKHLPVLDLELYLYIKEGRPQIGHRHYSKPMANTMAISMRSAMPMSMKRAILVQEGLRRSLNTSPEFFEMEKKDLMINFNIMMCQAEYTENFRLSVTDKVLRSYYEKRKRDRDGEKPLYRNRIECINDKRERERNKNKSNKVA